MGQNEHPFVTIDPPTPYDSLESWEKHLAELQALADETPLKDEMIKQAEEIISEKKDR